MTGFRAPRTVAAVNPDPIFETLLGYRKSAVLRAAIELDCFSAVASGRRSAAAIAAARGGTERSVRLLLDALASNVPAVLRKRGTGYELTPLSRRFLVRTSPVFIGPLLPLYGHRQLWDAFYDLPAAVRAGTSVMPTNAHTRGQKFWEDFARATAADAVPRARLMRRLLGRLPRGCEVLDLACGSGAYGATFARAGARVTLFDQKNVLRVTRNLVDVPVRYVEGDLRKTPFGGPYDVILASHVFHHFDPSECGALARKVAAALKPGGRAMLQEFVPDERRSRKAQPLMFGATMLVWTRAGDAYRVSDYRKWFAAAGLRRLRHFPLDLPGDFLLVSE